MNFNKKEYTSALLIMPSLSMLLAIYLLSLSILSLFNYYDFPFLYFNSNSLIVIILICVSILFVISSWYKLYLGLLLLFDKKPIQQLNGTVQKIKKVKFSPRFYINNKVTRAVILTIDSKEFYIMCEDRLSIGTNIIIKYFALSKIIIEWEEFVNE
jgi:hypothetical protein